MAADVEPLGIAKSPNGASIDIPITGAGASFPGEFLIVDIAFFASLPNSIEVLAGGTKLKSMGLWSREPDIAIQRFGATVPVSVSDAIHVTVDTPADPFVCVAYSLNGNFQRNVAAFVEPAKQSDGVANPVKFNPIWITPAGTDTVITTLALSHYTAGVWDGMTDINNVVDQLYAGHSEQGGNFNIQMNNAAPKDGNAVWLMVVSALAIHKQAEPATGLEAAPGSLSIAGAPSAIGIVPADPVVELQPAAGKTALVGAPLSVEAEPADPVAELGAAVGDLSLAGDAGALGIMPAEAVVALQAAAGQPTLTGRAATLAPIDSVVEVHAVPGQLGVVGNTATLATVPTDPVITLDAASGRLGLSGNAATLGILPTDSVIRLQGATGQRTLSGHGAILRIVPTHRLHIAWYRLPALLLALLVTSCGANAAAEPPVPAGAEIQWLLNGAHPVRPPVMLVGDTLTFRPSLVAEDGEEIATAPEEWTADYERRVLNLSTFRARALASTSPGRSTALVYAHGPTKLAAGIEIVVLNP